MEIIWSFKEALYIYKLTYRGEGKGELKSECRVFNLLIIG